MEPAELEAAGIGGGGGGGGGWTNPQAICCVLRSGAALESASAFHPASWLASFKNNQHFLEAWPNGFFLHLTRVLIPGPHVAHMC